MGAILPEIFDRNLTFGIMREFDRLNVARSATPGGRNRQSGVRRNLRYEWQSVNIVEISP